MSCSAACRHSSGQTAPIDTVRRRRRTELQVHLLFIFFLLCWSLLLLHGVQTDLWVLKSVFKAALRRITGNMLRLCLVEGPFPRRFRTPCRTQLRKLHCAIQGVLSLLSGALQLDIMTVSGVELKSQMFDGSCKKAARSDTLSGFFEPLQIKVTTD